MIEPRYTAPDLTPEEQAIVEAARQDTDEWPRDNGTMAAKADAQQAVMNAETERKQNKQQRPIPARTEEPGSASRPHTGSWAYSTKAGA